MDMPNRPSANQPSRLVDIATRGAETGGQDAVELCRPEIGRSVAFFGNAMWIVKIALERPYTFIVLALLILILSPIVILNTPTDIFPNINIPVVAVSWTYTGMNPEELEGRLTTVYEKVLTTLVDNIEHIESTTVNGTVVVKIFLQPTASVDRANAQVTAASQTILRQLPPGTLPPLIVNYTASSVPILQLALSGPGLSEAQLNDLALNFLRPQLVTVPGAAVPYPYGGKQREVMVNLDSGLLQSKGLSPQDMVNAVNAQNVIAPSGTAKIDQFEYDIATNSAPRTVEEMNSLPVKVVDNSTIYLRDVSHVSDGFIPQTNIVRQDGRRGVLATVIKDGDASTLSVVQGIRNLLPRVQQTLASATQDSTTGGPVRFRSRCHQRCCPRSWHRCRSDGVNDPDLSGKLAEHGNHRRFHSAGHLELRDCPQPSASNHQSDDAGRLGSGCRHPGGRRHGNHRKYFAAPGGRPAAAPGNSRRRGANRGTRARFHALYLHRFSTHVLFGWRGALSISAARRSRDLRDDRVVHPVANLGSDTRDVPAQTSGRKCRSLAQSLYPRTEGVRPGV